MRNNAILIILSGLLLCCSGCRTSAEFNYIEDSIQDQIFPAKLEKDFKTSLGPISMRMINGFVDDEEETDEFLKEIKAVQVGIYKIHNTEKSDSIRIPANIEKCMVEKGWEPFVRVRSRKKENVSLYYRQLSEDTASIYVIVLEPDELVITEINGKLHSILDKVICGHRLAGMDHL